MNLAEILTVEFKVANLLMQKYVFTLITQCKRSAEKHLWLQELCTLKSAQANREYRFSSCSENRKMHIMCKKTCALRLQLKAENVSYSSSSFFLRPEEKCDSDTPKVQWWYTSFFPVPLPCRLCDEHQVPEYCSGG